jgi:hypothetical protein
MNLLDQDVRSAKMASTITTKGATTAPKDAEFVLPKIIAKSALISTLSKTASVLTAAKT